MSDPGSEERALQIERALKESQDEERAERDADLLRQQQTDDVIVDALAQDDRPE